MSDTDNKHTLKVTVTTGLGMDVVKNAIHKDPDYAWGWQSALAMSMVDEGVARDIANRAAARFMSMTFDYQMENHEYYRDTQSDVLPVATDE